MRAHPSTHRHRHDTEPRSVAAHYDPGWRWNRQATTPLRSPRSESRARPTSVFASAESPLEDPAAGDAFGLAASRLRSSAAAYGASTPYVPSPKPQYSSSLLSGQPRSLGYGAEGRDGVTRADSSRHAAHEGRRSSLGYTALLPPPPPTLVPPATGLGRSNTAAEDAALYGGPHRSTERSGAARAAVSPLPVRLSNAAMAGAPLRVRPESRASPPVAAAAPHPSSCLIPPPQPQDAGKLVVVLDLDETLVYSRDVTLYARPGVTQLLKTLKGQCELIVWTAGTREYALDVIKVIDTVCAVQHCIYRHPMWWSGDAGCAKDLRLLGRPMDRVILVDNTPSVFSATPRNSLLVSDFVVPLPRSYNAQERVLPTLTDIFDHVFRRFAHPCLADVLASKRVTRQLVHLENGTAVELNVLTVRSTAEAGWATSTRASRLRYST